MELRAGVKQHGKYAVDEMKRRYSLTDLEDVKLENCANGFSRNVGCDLFYKNEYLHIDIYNTE